MNQQAALQLQVLNVTPNGSQENKESTDVTMSSESTSTDQKTTNTQSQFLQPREPATSAHPPTQPSGFTSPSSELNVNSNMNGFPASLQGHPYNKEVNGLHANQGQLQLAQQDNRLADSWNKQATNDPNNHVAHQNGGDSFNHADYTKPTSKESLNLNNNAEFHSVHDTQKYPSVSSMVSPFSPPRSTQAGSNPYQPLSVSNTSGSLLSPGMLSPNMLSPHPQLASPNTPKSGGNMNGFKSPKISLLLDQKQVPRPPTPPQPPLSVDKLSPPTPSITVSNTSFILLRCISICN